MEIPQSKALEIIGEQRVEIVVLREHIGLLQQHQCEPCQAECCVEGRTQDEYEA